MSVCIKCNNAYKIVPKNNDLYKKCRVCNFEEKAIIEDYKILSENFSKKGNNYLYNLLSATQDITCPIVEVTGKNGEVHQFTVIVEPKTLKRIYISNKDKKAYTNISQFSNN